MANQVNNPVPTYFEYWKHTWNPEHVKEVKDKTPVLEEHHTLNNVAFGVLRVLSWCVGVGLIAEAIAGYKWSKLNDCQKRHNLYDVTGEVDLINRKVFNNDTIDPKDQRLTLHLYPNKRKVELTYDTGKVFAHRGYAKDAASWDANSLFDVTVDEEEKRVFLKKGDEKPLKLSNAVSMFFHIPEFKVGDYLIDDFNVCVFEKMEGWHAVFKVFPYTVVVRDYQSMTGSKD